MFDRFFLTMIFHSNNVSAEGMSKRESKVEITDKDFTHYNARKQ